MKNKVITYRSEKDNVVYTVIEEPSNDRKRIVFYLTTKDIKENIVLADIQTVANIQGVSYTTPAEVAKYLNEQGSGAKKTFTTTFTFKYFMDDSKELPYTHVIDYMLPKHKHEIVVVTPDEKIIEIE